MKILEVSDTHSHGGSGIASNRIHSCLLSGGKEIMRATSDSEEHLSLFPGRKFFLMQSLLSYFGFNNLSKTLFSSEIKKQFSLLLRKTNPQTVHFHNIHCANWPIDIVKTALDYTSVIWTLHDCWSFLGKFYPHHCPEAPSQGIAKIESFWKSVSNHKNQLVAITPSHWMREAAAKSKWRGRRITTICNPLPKSHFDIIDRQSAKKIIGLRSETPIILLISANLSEKRKGGDILNSIIQSKLIEKAQFLLVGNTSTIEIPSHPNLVKMGYIKDEITLKVLYSAADLLLHPARIDNLPNTVAESLSAGTPVLAFKVGGLPEMVIPDKSGWLVDNPDCESISRKLETIISTKSYAKLRESSKLTALKLFNSENVSKLYHNEFEALHSI